MYFSIHFVGASCQHFRTWMMTNGMEEEIFRNIRRNIYQTQSSRTQTQAREMLFLQKTHPISWTLNPSTPPGETQKHSQNASSKEPKGIETVPWTRRILQKICPQIRRHFKSSNTFNKKGRRIQMDTRVQEMFPDTKGILETGTDTQIP